MKINIMLLFFGITTNLFANGNRSEMQLIIKNLRSNKGSIIIVVDSNEKTYKTADEKDAFMFTMIKATKSEINLTLHSIPKGKYAITTFHDENSNFELDTNFIGIPKEGLGFSRPIKLSADIKFSDISVEQKNEKLKVAIKMEY